jgi:hypothetical protein
MVLLRSCIGVDQGKFIASSVMVTLNIIDPETLEAMPCFELLVLAEDSAHS